MISDADTAVRLLLAAVLGGVIGYERQAKHKSAGLRTHMLVSIGSCLIMVLSINLYSAVQGLTNADPARLAAQVVSGIGFLGAGSIMKEGLTIKGLTTAASLWVVAGVGLAAGSGFFSGALLSTGLVVGILLLLGQMEGRLIGCPQAQLIVISADGPGQIGKIGTCLGLLEVLIRDIRIEREMEGRITHHILAQLPEQVTTAQLCAELAAVEGVVSVQADYI